MPEIDLLGSPNAALTLYLPHRPKGLEDYVDQPCAPAVTSANSNHWRKIINLLAKVASPVASDWRDFRDQRLFGRVSLCFVPVLQPGCRWHWIAGKENLQRFSGLQHSACPVPVGGQLAGNIDCDDVRVDSGQRLLLSPYPDYRQLDNQRVALIRAMLSASGFYGAQGI